MPSMKPIQEVFQQVVILLRTLPEELEAWLNRVTMRAHQPTDVGLPGEPIAWCTRCDEDWPCPTATEISDRNQGYKATRQ